MGGERNATNLFPIQSGINEKVLEEDLIGSWDATVNAIGDFKVYRLIEFKDDHEGRASYTVSSNDSLSCTLNASFKY